jgi:aspartyl-tRNA(Asn)/glutamyl-tRNA(Gln) amidotransferase subunit B
MKNMNSFKMIHRAVEFEAKRQIAVLEQGGTIIQETRRWDENKDASFSMRTKENAQDYRYFPEPDLLPMDIGEDWIERTIREMPELPEAKRERYKRDFALSAYDAAQLTSSREISALFEDVAARCGKPKEAANLIMVELMRLMGDDGILPEDLRVDAAKLATLINLITGGKINRNTGKEVFERIFRDNVEPEAYVKERGLLMLDDDNAVTEAVEAALAANPQSVADYRGGKEKAFGFLVGQIMKALKGKANPQVVNKVLREKLG